MYFSVNDSHSVVTDNQYDAEQGMPMAMTRSRMESSWEWVAF